MYWTLELASKLEDAPWPATKDELIELLKTCRKWRMKAKYMKALKIFGLTIRAKKTSFLTRRNISAILSAKTTIKSLSINKIGGDLICLDNSV